MTEPDERPSCTRSSVLPTLDTVGGMLLMIWGGLGAVMYEPPEGEGPDFGRGPAILLAVVGLPVFIIGIQKGSAMTRCEEAYKAYEQRDEREAAADPAAGRLGERCRPPSFPEGPWTCDAPLICLPSHYCVARESAIMP